MATGQTVAAPYRQPRSMKKDLTFFHQVVTNLDFNQFNENLS